MPVERTGVAVAALSASQALDLLSIVIEVSNPDQRERWLESARQESENLQRAAKEDVAAYNRYLACLRRPSKASPQDLDRALRVAIAIPLRAAHCAAAGIDLCLTAAGSVRAAVAADLGVATELLAGSVRAMLRCVDANLRLLDAGDPYLAAVRDERRELEERASASTSSALRLVSRA
jgi:formiminotetrahydrofolate cyclodeaminase